MAKINETGKYTPEVQEYIKKRKFDELQLRLELKNKRQILCASLKDIRLTRGISQSTLAQYMNVDQNYISRVESGKINITIDKLLQYTYYLDCLVKIKGKRSGKVTAGMNKMNPYLLNKLGYGKKKPG